jgi:pyruvate dehydrogenase E2 component (dihydrolipoamide acetyltransferase)
MATIVRMPEVLANSTEAALQTWLIKVGETVAIGQPLAEIETEKAMVEYNAEVEGVLVRHLVEEGTSVEVGAPIGVIAAVGEAEPDVEALLAGEAPAEPAIPAPTPTAPPVSLPAAAVLARPAAAAAIGERQFASPIVRRMAKERSLDLSGVVGSGPNGRIVRRDLDHIQSTPAPAQAAPPVSPPAPAAAGAAGFTDIPHTGMRKAIARRLTESKSTVPHFYVTADCRVDRLLALRSDINATSPRKISVNDFVVKAVAGALTDVPAANAIWTDAATRRFDHVDLAVAVSTEGGLLTPVLRGVDGLSLTEISGRIADLAERARRGRLQQQELEGGSFAVSNLGMFGVDQFSAILNPPQSGILAVGTAKQRAVVEDGELVVGTVMTATLSADHRVIDGAVAAEWMAAFVKRIENPLSILI